MASIFIKDPEAVLDYGWDWSDWLEDGETITDSTWTVETGIVKDSDSHTTTRGLVWLSGGTIGEDYTVVNHIETSAGREDDRTITIRVRAR